MALKEKLGTTKADTKLILTILLKDMGIYIEGVISCSIFEPWFESNKYF